MKQYDFLIELGPTPAERCPYLPDRQSSLLVFQPIFPGASDFDTLLSQGYRRHGTFFYKPVCPGGCCECTPIRVPVQDFRPSKSQRRLLRRVRDLYKVRLIGPMFTQEHVNLFNKHARYVSDPTPSIEADDYRDFLLRSEVNTLQFEYRIDRALVGVGILDIGENAASSTYFCWDPDWAHASPGTFSGLWEIEYCRARGHDHYYLGYWIRDCGQMSYKNRFRPFELMDWGTGEWTGGHPAAPSSTAVGS